MKGFLRVKGEKALNMVRDRAKAIAPALGMEKELADLNQLMTDLLGTGQSKRLVSPITRARVLCEPVDPDRIPLLNPFIKN